MAQPKPASGEGHQEASTPDPHEAELSSLEAFIAKVSDSKDPATQQELARALMRRAMIQSRLGRAGDEMTSCEALIRRFTMSDNPQIATLVAMAHNRRGRALVVADRLDEALTAFDLAWATSTGWKEPELARQAAAALYATGALRKRQGRTAEAMSAWSDITRQFGEHGDAEVAAKAVSADHARAALLRDCERVNDAARVYYDLMVRAAKRPEPVFIAAAGEAALRRAECLMDAKYPKGAVEACDSALVMLADEGGSAARWRVALGALRARALRALGRRDEAVAALRELDRCFGEDPDALIACEIAQAVVEATEAMLADGEFARASALCDLVVRRYGASADEALQKTVQRSRRLAADALAGMNDAGGALVALKDWVGEQCAQPAIGLPATDYADDQLAQTA